MNTVAECQERMAQAMRSGAWLDYFQARARWHELENASLPTMPPPEHTTLDDWPEGFALPGGAAKLRKAAEAAGWEVRSGYSRAFRKGVGRGTYHRCHFVMVQAQKGSQRVSGVWWAKADAEKLAWSWDAGTVNGWHADTVGKVTEALKAEGDATYAHIPGKRTCPDCKGRGRVISPHSRYETLGCDRCVGAGVV